MFYFGWERQTKNMNLKLGDTFIYFCSAIYFSREAWEHGHWKGVVGIWVVGVLLNAFHSYMQNKSDKKTEDFYAGLTKEIEDKKNGTTDPIILHNQRIEEKKQQILAQKETVKEDW